MRDTGGEAGADCSAGGAQGPVAPDMAAARAAAVAVPVTESERVALLDAAGRVLARTIHSPTAVPPFDNSAMDGYALRTAELVGEGPWRLRVAGRSAAGDGVGKVAPGPGAAMRILTGAPVPTGFDAVVMQERCDREGDDIVVRRAPSRGANIRLTGEDVRLGAGLMEAGELISPQRLALLAGAGIGEVDVLRKVRVGLVSTGSELREPGETLAPGQIYNSNRVLLRAMLADCRWAQVEDFGIVPDERERLAAVFSRAVESCDVIVTTGGVSAGDEDHVAAVLRDKGARLEIMRVAMRPGKPLKVGRLGEVLFAGLPGNPNAALATFCRIALPAIRVVAGLRDIEPVWHAGVAGFSYVKRVGREEFVPVRICDRTAQGVPVLQMLGRGSSASLSAMAGADGIARLPAAIEAVEPGMAIRFERFLTH